MHTHSATAEQLVGVCKNVKSRPPSHTHTHTLCQSSSHSPCFSIFFFLSASIQWTIRPLWKELLVSTQTLCFSLSFFLPLSISVSLFSLSPSSLSGWLSVMMKCDTLIFNTPLLAVWTSDHHLISSADICDTYTVRACTSLFVGHWLTTSWEDVCVCVWVCVCWWGHL